MTAPAVRRSVHSARRVLTRLRRTTRRNLATPSSDGTSASERFTAPIEPSGGMAAPGPRIVLLNDCRDQVNFGANALVDGLIALVRDAVPDATLLPIPSHWLIDTAHGLGAFAQDGAGMRQPRASYPKVADQFEAVADDWLEGRGGPGASQFLERFEGADLVLLNGEGSIYRSNLSAVRELFLAWLCRTRLGIPTAYVNGGVHLTDVMPILPAMVRKTFPVLDAVAVREPPSLRNVQCFVPDVDAALFPDAAFVFGPDEARTTPEVRRVLDQLGDQPYFCFDPGAMPMDDRVGGSSALHQLVSTLREVAPQAVFVNSGPADRYIERIAHDTGALYVDTIAGWRELMALVGGAAFQVSGRYHNVILAAIMGCPSVALASTSHKVHGACEMLDGVVGSPYDGTNLIPELGAIAEQAETYVRQRDDIAARLDAVCIRRRDDVQALGGLVARLVKATR